VVRGVWSLGAVTKLDIEPLSIIDAIQPVVTVIEIQKSMTDSGIRVINVLVLAQTAIVHNITGKPMANILQQHARMYFIFDRAGLNLTAARCCN
jgi:hypothetical protein